MAEILGPQRLGPLTPLVGEWEGNVGVDLSYHHDDASTGENGSLKGLALSPHRHSRRTRKRSRCAARRPRCLHGAMARRR